MSFIKGTQLTIPRDLSHFISMMSQCQDFQSLRFNIKLPEHCTLHSLCFFLINIQTSEKLPMESISDPGLQPVLMLPVRIQYYNLSKIVLLKVFKHIIEILILLFYLLIQTHYCSGVWFPLSLLFFSFVLRKLFIKIS